MKKLFLHLILLFGLFTENFAQKRPFQNFSVDKGLIQSQVICITQDNQHHLWLGTYGGLDRFDGKTFTHFSKNEGLNSSAISCIYAARNNILWAGTFKGISSYDGYKITNYPVQEQSGSFNFTRITEDETGAIWAFNYRQGLFVCKNNQFVKAPVPFNGAVPTCLFKDFNNRLLASFYKTGVFWYHKNGW